ncbi:MAG: hypothetical protein P4M07_11575 [Xanthobacteraceae bacterium]|nr:hypothetical protein [Xanthobacteraceae bacterium]
MAGYSQAQINILQGYIKAAQDALAQNDTEGALNSLNQYYSSQTATRGYASDALQVINNQGLFGVTANNDVSNAIGATRYQQIRPQLMVSLATADLNTIISNDGGIPTENQINNYHFLIYPDFDIPTTAFGGAADAALGRDWSLGTFTAAELDANPLDNSFAQNFTGDSGDTLPIARASSAEGNDNRNASL